MSHPRTPSTRNNGKSHTYLQKLPRPYTCTETMAMISLDEFPIPLFFSWLISHITEAMRRKIELKSPYYTTKTILFFCMIKSKEFSAGKQQDCTNQSTRKYILPYLSYPVPKTGCRIDETRIFCSLSLSSSHYLITITSFSNLLASLHSTLRFSSMVKYITYKTHPKKSYEIFTTFSLHRSM